MKHLDQHNILAENQHAFRRGRSCESQLILTFNDLASYHNNGTTTDVAVLDFSKAFDVVPHRKLLHKLDFYGIRGQIKNWIASFLTNRLQRVAVNGEYSSWHQVLSGVPQGTVLGPHLFLLFINDIQNAVRGVTRLFADDCLIYHQIKSTDDEKLFQADLDRLIGWATTWGMRFNASKCKTMRISRKRNPGEPSYEMDGVRLEATKESTYLGIQIQNDLGWEKQTQHAVTKATRVLNFIKRNFYMCSKNVKERLYLTLVRPHLDYGVAAWNPYKACQRAAIENVQRRAARFVFGDYGRQSSVSSMLSTLEWEKLSDRRQIHQLTQFYKIIHQAIDVDASDYLQQKIQRARRGNNKQFQVNQISSTVYKNSFFPKCINVWNDLPQPLIDSATYKTFRDAYANHIRTSDN